MDLVDKKLGDYCALWSKEESPLLKEINRQTHLQTLLPNMLSGHLQGMFLSMISKMIAPKCILEIGTFTGYSTICLAKGLDHDSMIITIELNDELTAFSNSYFCRAGVESKIIQMTGKAQDIIPALDHKFDLVFIDGDKREYIEYYRLIIDKVNIGGFILADNVLWGGKALAGETNDPQASGIISFNKMIKNEKRIEIVTIPLRDGLMLIRKKE